MLISVRRAAQRQPGSSGFGFDARYIIRHSPKFYRGVRRIENDVGRKGRAVTRFTNAADINEVFPARFELEPRIDCTSHDMVSNEGDGNMSMAEEANRCGLIREARGSG